MFLSVSSSDFLGEVTNSAADPPTVNRLSALAAATGQARATVTFSCRTVQEGRCRQSHPLVVLLVGITRE